MYDTQFREDGNHMTQKHNPVVHYLRVLVYMLLALVLRVIAFAPLYCLTLDSAWKYLWVLCPVLLLFVVLPSRFSFAQALVNGLEDRSFSLKKAFCPCHYTEKLREALLHALHVIKWGLPMAALGVFAYVWYTQVDAITVIRSVSELGAWASSVWCSVVNLFGAEQAPVINGLMEGVYTVLVIIALAALIWAIGVLRNSASRYIWAIAARNDRVPSAERRRRLRGRRLSQLAVGLINLVLLVPFLAVSGKQLMNIVSDLSGQLMMVMVGSLPQLDLSGVAQPLILAFAGLYLPLLPIRRMMTASFACSEKKQKAAKVSAEVQ